MNKNGNTTILGPIIPKKFVILLNIISILMTVDFIFFQYVNPLITILTCIFIPAVCFIIYFIFRKNFTIYDVPNHLNEHKKKKLDLDLPLGLSTSVLLLFSLSSVNTVFSKSFITIIVAIGLVVILIPFFFLKERYSTIKAQIFSFLFFIFLYILGVILNINSAFGNLHLGTSRVVVNSVKKETRKFIYTTYTANVKTNYSNKSQFAI